MNTASPPELEFGRYQHYKGGVYQIVTLARHTETLEWYVVYKAVGETERKAPSVWVRPYEMFVEEVVVGGKVMKRFEKIS